MQAKKRTLSPEDLFRSRLDQLLDNKHPLFKLANSINWEYFEEEFGLFYVENKGRPGKPIRLLVGLHYLKHTYNESDESVVERFLENPYCQYFCGFEYFQHEFPLDPTSLVKWRNRIGEDGKDAYCDRGYRGYKYDGNANIHIAGQRNRGRPKTRTQRKWLRRRNAIEPKIGHLKTENRMNKNYLKGTNGDRINAYLSGCGANLRKLLAAFFLSFFIFDRIIEKLAKYFQRTVNTKSQIHYLEA